MKATLHINGLAASHNNIRPIYSLFADDQDVVFTDSKVRSYALKPWPQADTHVLHLHWIDHVGAGTSLLHAVRQALQLVLYLMVTRIRRSRVVWTMHNGVAHEVKHSRLEKLTQRAVAELSNDIHLPNPSLEEFVMSRWPARLSSKVVVLPLPDPAADMPRRSRFESRRVNGMNESEVVLLAFGVVRPYKGLESLAVAFRNASSPNAKLVIAGSVKDQDVASTITDILKDDARAVLRLEEQSEQQLADLFMAADWLVLPYLRSQNSGVLTTALGFGVPLIVSDLPSLTEPLADDPACRLLVSPPGDPDALRSRIEEVAALPPALRGLASAAACTVGRLENSGLKERYRQLYVG